MMSGSPHSLSQINSASDLRRLTLLSAFGISAAGAALIVIILYAGWASDQSSLQRERSLLENGIDRGISRMLSEQKSVAWWDDAVTKIVDDAVDFEFADANFGVFLTETYGHDEVYILNAEDKPLYAFARRVRRNPKSFERYRRFLSDLITEARSGFSSSLTQRADVFGADQVGYRLLGGSLNRARWSGHKLSVNGRLALVSAVSIVPNVDLSLLQGQPKLLVSIKYIDQRLIRELGGTILLKDLTLVPAPVGADGIYSQLIIADDGGYGGYFSWRMQRPGHLLLTSILPLVVLGVVAVAGLAQSMLRRLQQSSANLAQREMQSRYDAYHDALSHLPNRAHFVERLNGALVAVDQSAGEDHVFVAYIDIDRFKDVNDTLGHHVGDELIKEVARRLQTRLRPGDVLARYGGDEFALLVAQASPNEAESLGKRIGEAFETRFEVNGQSLAVTASTGIAVARVGGVGSDELMRHADIALYEAKSQGRNRAVVFADAMAKQVEERRAIELDLRVAMEEGQLRLNYQPIVSCENGKIIGVEALLRWRHPSRGDIPPVTFIPIAEQAGLMPELGEWVLGRAIDDWWRWPELQVSVNLSPAQFRHVDVAAQLERLVGETNIDPNRFVLEITEGVLMDSTERTRSILQAIRTMGFKTGLDDFGTGYSSLSYLCNFQFDKLKIDRSFVAGMLRSDSHRVIVEAVIALGKGLGMGIVAEGVETEAEAVAMQKLGCTELQGYYFSRPIEADQMSALLRSYIPCQSMFACRRPEAPKLLATAG